jgi:hypothetical protein
VLGCRNNLPGFFNRKLTLPVAYLCHHAALHNHLKGAFQDVDGLLEGALVFHHSHLPDGVLAKLGQLLYWLCILDQDNYLDFGRSFIQIDNLEKRISYILDQDENTLLICVCFDDCHTFLANYAEGSQVGCGCPKNEMSQDDF